MMTNLLNGAHVANKLFSTIARLRLLLVMFLTLTVSANVWGATLTLNNLGSSLSNTSNSTISTTTITATGNNASSYIINYLQCKKQSSGSSHAMLLAKSTGAFISNKTAMPGNIKSVTVYVLTGAAGKTTYHCAFSTTECTSAYTTGSTAVNITGGNSNKYTCTVSNAKYFCISLGNANNGQVYKLDVEYEVDTPPSCTTNPTVSAGSNSSVTTTTATVSCSGGITSLGSAGCSIESYGFVYGTSSDPTISNTKVQVGTTYTTTGTAFTRELTGLTANTTYYVRPYATNGNGTAYGTQTSFKTLELPKYTVTFDAGSGSCSTPNFTQTSTTRSIDLPSASTTCEGWTFAGWCISSAGNEDENSTSPGTILLPGDPYTPSSNHTLYAVYTRSESGGTATSYVKVSADNVTTGTYVIAAIRSSSVSSNYYPATGSISSGDMVVSDKTFTLTNETFTEIPDGGIEFTFTGDNTNGFTINNGSGNLGYASNSNRKLAFGDYTTKWKVYDHDNPQAGVYLQHSDESSYYTITENSTGTTPIRGYASNTKYRSIYLFKKGNASTTYYMTNLICSTEPSVILNPNGGNFATEPEGWTKDGDNYVIKHTGTEILLPTNISQENKNFVGWYDGETKYETIPADLTESITLTAKWSDKQDPGIAWNPTTCTVTIDAGEELPTFQNPNELMGITFTSSHPSVASVDNNGVITLGTTATTATVTITATFDGDATYAAKNVTCTLTVNPSNCRWVETNTIEDGDEVVITMTGTNGITYTLYNTVDTKNAPFAIEVNNILGTYITSVINDVKWVVNKDGDDLTFKSYLTNDYLYCINQNGDGVRVGNTSSSKIFIIDNESGYLKHKETSRYLGYQIQDWRCYSNKDNFAGQTLKFYKRECLDSEHYWVTWDAGEGTWTDGSSNKLESYQVGETIIVPAENPTREGYRFDGWTPNPGTMPAQNTTFTAVWTQLHTITWMVGSNSVLTEEVANATGVTQTPPADPANDAIGNCADAFVGWSETPLGSTEGQSAPADLCTAAQMKAKHTSVTGDKTFYAVFATAKTDEGEDDVTTTFDFTSGYEDGTAIGTKTQDGVTITFGKGDNNSNKPTYYESGNAVRVYAKNTITVACTGLTKITFTFGSDDGSNTITANTASFSTPTWTGSANSVKFTIGGPSGNRRIQQVAVTYTATTSITTYSNYVTNCCNTPAPTDGAYTSVSGTEIQLTWNDAANTNRYHITGGNLSAEGVYETNKYYNIIGLTECEEYTFYISAHPTEGCESEAITITAQPFSGAKTVTFNPNGGAVSPTSFTTSCDKNSTSLPTPTNSGYRFMGWFTAANGGTEITGTSYTPTADITLFAHWEKEYTVTYDANGGSTTCANGNYIEGETVTICTTNPTKTGYTFAGWTYSPEVTITDGKFTMPANNVTITAQWTINQYTVTWIPNGGNWAGSTENIVHTYDYGATINLPADPTRDGYRFIGWNTTVASTMPATNITYTAQWKQNYTITFHDGDDTTPWTQTADAESIDLNTYVGTHACGEYNFAGWSTDATQYNDQTANITTWVTGTYTPTASIDLYAVYVKGDLATDFTLNCDGGVYEIWEKGHNQHMAGRQNGGGNKFYTTEWYNGDYTSCEGTDGAPFTITKVADNTYTLQNADGQYITGNTYDEDDLDIEDTWENADKYKWTISNGINGTWRFTNKAATSYALVYYNNRYFELRSASSVTAGNTTTYDLELTPAQTNVYQSNPNCGPYTITFETHGGVFIQGNYAYPTAVTSNLTGKTTSKFPAAELDGYTFAGWKDGTPQDEINYEPYLKKAGDNLVVSSNKTYHAVYYYYDEEEDIDWSEEFTTGIYADVNGIKYFLAGTPDRGTMSSTTDCGYVSEVTITPGTGENAGKYKITVNGVGMAPEAGETDLVDGTAWWTITETSVGSGEYKISGEDKRNIVLLNSSFGHYSYNAGSSYGAGYYYPRFGKCLEHHWTSNPVDVYTMTWKIDEYIHATTTVQSGKTITALPTNPLDNDLGCCADKFIGWTASTAQTISKADVFTTLAEAQAKFPNITEDKTFYAVFATAAQGVGTSIADFSEMGYENGTAVTDPIVLGDGEGHGDATITLAKAQSSSNAPTYYTDGEAVRIYAGGTITIASTYAGATIKNITFEFGADDGVNAITYSTGEYSEGIWTGDANSVTFTISGSTGHRRIASITVTTGVSGSQYTNYVTQCTTLQNPALSDGSVPAIAVNCGDFSTLSNSQAIVFSTMQNLTCPVTFEVIEGDFLISTARDRAAQYQSKVKVVPYKTGENFGKLKNVYVRANATDHNEDFTGTLKVTSDEIADDIIIYLTATVTCDKFTLTTVDHLGNETEFGTYFAGEVIDTEPTPSSDECTAGYTFDGWSTSAVEYGSLIYNKVSFPYTMPNHDVILYPVYRINDTEDYHRVTSDLGANNWAGDYLIANAPTTFVDGKTSALNVADMSGEGIIVNEVVSAYYYGDPIHVSLISVEGGYVLKTQDGKYIYNTEGQSAGTSVNENITTADDHPLSVTFTSLNEIVIKNPLSASETYFSFSSTSKFGFYKGSSIYLYKKSPLYTSYLACGTISVSEEEVYVTATKQRGIMANQPLTVTANNMYPNAQVIVTSNNADVYFSAERNANFAMAAANQPQQSLTLTANETGALLQSIYIHYRPSSEGDGVPADVEVTAQSHNLPISDNHTIHVRNLPAKFVIATKVGAVWYALPANMTEPTNPSGVVIEVDETNMTAIAPTTTTYTLWPVKTTNGTGDRYQEYGERLRFAAVNYGQRGLWANNAQNSATIQNYAVIDELGDGESNAYEWKVTTTVIDGHWQYTLQNDQEKNKKYLCYCTSAEGGAKWGTYESVGNTLYLLPMTEITEMNVEVMEWGTNSMALRFEGDAPANVDITLGETTTNVTLTNLNSGSTSDIYKVEGVALTTNDGEVLKIVDNTSNNIKLLCKPILVTGESVSTAYSTLETTVCDVVVLNGGKLSAGDAHVDFANIYVYPGGKLILDGKSLGAKQQVYLRGGYSWLNSEYALPELYLNGTIDFNGSGNIIYDYYIQNYKYYQFALPYDVQLAKVTDEAGIDNFPVWVKHYNGALRAVDPHATSWEWYPSENGDANAYFKAGEGYIIAAQPRQVGNTANRPLSIIRFPLGNKVFNKTNGLETDRTITTTAHGINGYKAGTVTANNVGWNFIGNPFMSTWQGDIGYKQLTKHPNEANWDGTYDWVDADIKYITIMSAESGSDYAQYIASETELKPFFPFYLQETAEGGTGTINFAAANRIQKAPAMLSAETPREAFVQIEITAEGNTDQTGMFIGDRYSDDIDFDDYEKMFGSSTDKPKVWLMHEGKRMAFEAMTESTAATYIPLGYRAPQTGKYMFAINEEASKLSDVEAVYLTDNQTGVTDFDLLSSAYEFESDNELYNDTRFTIHIVLRDESPGTTTGVGNLLHFNSEQPMKFIYQDKMYILQNGVIYDAMGKQVQTINK